MSAILGVASSEFDKCVSVPTREKVTAMIEWRLKSAQNRADALRPLLNNLSHISDEDEAKIAELPWHRLFEQTY